jgi:hypothetical protein
MNAGRKDIWEPIAKALAENWKTATEDARDSWDFGFPDREELWHDASYVDWARAPFWSADECAALALGKDPGQISGLDIDQLYRTAVFGSHLEHVREEILAAQADKELAERIRPVEFIAWAREKKIRLPDQLEAAVLDNEANVAALQCRNTNLRHEIQELRYQLDRLRAAADAAPKPEPKEVTPRQRSSLLKMVIAMAMTKYGYDPAKRNTAAEDIADEIRERGMQLSDDTVRDFLKKAADEEMPKQQADEKSA